MNESKLFYPIKKFCDARHFPLWSEVLNKSIKNGNIVDVVVQLSHKIYFAVELKTSLNIEVIAQAVNNQKYFNASIVAVPKLIKTDRRHAHFLLNHLGIGLIELHKENEELVIVNYDNVFDIVPKITKRPTKGMKNVEKWLFDQQKDFVAGQKNNYYTYRQEVKKEIIDYLKEANIALIDDIYPNYKHVFQTHKNFLAFINENKEFNIVLDDEDTIITLK